MSNLYDLHMHSYYSDGRASPEEMLRHAAQIGLKVVAITDHDNVRAYDDAASAAAELGLELVPGIEFTCRWEACVSPDGQLEDVDVLGYFIDPQDPAFLSFTAQSLSDLLERVDACRVRLARAGYPVSQDEVRAENPRFPGSMQLLWALEHKGLVAKWREGVDLVNTHWPQVHPSQIAIQQVIAAIHAAGGVAVLAHPVQVRCGDGRLEADQLAQLVEAGLDGIEVLHPRLDQDARLHFALLARRFDLLMTGGSDEHGWRDFSRMGSEPVTEAMFQALRERARPRAG